MWNYCVFMLIACALHERNHIECRFNRGVAKYWSHQLNNTMFCRISVLSSNDCFGGLILETRKRSWTICHCQLNEISFRWQGIGIMPCVDNALGYRRRQMRHHLTNVRVHDVKNPKAMILSFLWRFAAMHWNQTCLFSDVFHWWQWIKIWQELDVCSLLTHRRNSAPWCRQVKPKKASARYWPDKISWSG